ncbi:MAG TPA: DUF692 domain-containing protein [Bryobacteraceae bacterium]|jgi:uncharacterized protein|nr:DUF692 domain-containing protein [Bryobacteraceae bacterium]
MRDRVGIGWRPELAAGILSSLDQIDVVELIAEEYFDASGRELRALGTLAAQVPVTLHGLSLGMASTSPVERRRLERMARLVDRLRPESWSEHLAFVRAGGIEIGHLAAPPRTSVTVEAAALNLDAARRVVGCAPLMENIATLIDPPASDLDEPEWLRRTLQASGAELLLDIHNLYVNSVNFGMDPEVFLRRLPADRIRAVHIAGGRSIGERILDDHLHDPPDPVYRLLESLAARCPHPLTVILERDGAYPPIAHLLSQIGRARTAIGQGRARRAA